MKGNKKIKVNVWSLGKGVGKLFWSIEPGLKIKQLKYKKMKAVS